MSGMPRIIHNKMLTIRSVKLHFERLVIPPRMTHMELGYRGNSTSNHYRCTQTDTSTFQWRQDISMPLYYNIPIEFVFRADGMSHNPEEPNALLVATLKIANYRQSMQECFVFNQKREKVAELYVTYRVANEKIVIPESQGCLKISSILAHLDEFSGNKGYIQIMLGAKSVFTPEVPLVVGELLWAEQLVIPIDKIEPRKEGKEGQNKTKEEGKELTVKVGEVDEKKVTKKQAFVMFQITVDSRKVGIACLQLKTAGKTRARYRRVEIEDPEGSGEIVGMLFIDLHYRKGVEASSEIVSSNRKQPQPRSLSSQASPMDRKLSRSNVQSRISLNQKQESSRDGSRVLRWGQYGPLELFNLGEYIREPAQLTRKHKEHYRVKLPALPSK